MKLQGDMIYSFGFGSEKTLNYVFKMINPNFAKANVQFALLK